MNNSHYEGIWVFGDSFAAASVVGPHWSKFLANHYNIPEKTLNTTNLGKPGTSLDFLYHEWNRTRHLINGNDFNISFFNFSYSLCLPTLYQYI